MYLLESMPESNSMLVTALEENGDISSTELVSERLLHEERKFKGKEAVFSERAITVNTNKGRSN